MQSLSAADVGLKEQPWAAMLNPVEEVIMLLVQWKSQNAVGIVYVDYVSH